MSYKIFHRNIYFITVSLLILNLSACTSNTIYKKPKDLIPRNEMIDIMTDLYIAKAAYHIKNKNDERQINYAPLIYEKYGIDSVRFSQSSRYYMSKIDEYEKMHEKISERIEKMIAETETEKPILEKTKTQSEKLKPKETN